MLEWSKINSWQKFQRLVNALFELEMNSTDFNPSDPNIGADGGQDAILRNNGNYSGKTGTFLIQTKHKKEGTQPKDAFKDVKKELLKKEFANYKKHNADWLFMCVNVTLNTTTDYRAELKKLAQDNKVNMVLCDKEWLEIRIHKHPYLIKWWFESVQSLSIETPKAYFAKYENQLIAENVMYCATRYTDLNNKFTTFLKSNDKFMGIFAPGGEGKTHYLRNIILNENQKLGRKCYFLKDLEKGISEIFEHELNSDQPYLLVVDDLDKWIQSNLRSLLKHVYHSKTIQLLFTSRIVNKQMFKEFIESMQITNHYLFSFSVWEQKELLEILHNLTGRDKLEDETALVTNFNKPFYIKLIADSLNRAEHVIAENVVSLVTNNEKKLFKSVISSYINIDTFSEFDILLFEISLVLPTLRIDDVLKIFIQHFNISSDVSKKIVNSLINDGFFRQVGRSLRFSPDMKGDIFIVNASETLDDDQINTTMEKYFNLNPDRVVKNIFYSISYEDRSKGIIKNRLKKITDNLLAGFTLSNIDQLSNIFNKIEYLARIYPDEGAQIAEDTLSFIGQNKLSKQTWNSDKFATLLKTLMIHEKCDSRVIQSLFKMNDLKLDGYYDNQKVHSLLRYFVSPAYFRIEVVASRLDMILKINVTPANAQLFKAVIQELLSGAYEHSKSLSHSFVLGAVPFNNSDKGIMIRNKCITFAINKLLLANEKVLVVAALDIIDGLGQIHLGGVSTDSQRNIRLDHERRNFLDALNYEKFLFHNFQIVSRVEKMLLRWWSSDQIDFQSEIEQFLISKIPINSEFLLYKYFERGGLCILKPFKDYYQECPQEVTKKWHWLVNNVEANTYRWKEENYINFVNHLQNEHPTVDSKISLFDRLRDVADLSFDKIWDVWANLATDEFYKIFQDKEKWGHLPKAVQKIVFRHLAEKFPKVMEEYKKSFYTKLPEPDADEMSLFLSLIKNNPTERKRLFDIFAEKASHPLVSSLLFELRRESQAVKIDFLNRYLIRTTNFDDHKTEDNIAFMLRLFSENNVNFINDNLRQLLAQKLLSTKIWGDNIIEIFQIAKFSKEQLWELFENRKLNDWRSEEKVPYLFISSLNRIFTPESYEFIFYKLLDFEYHIWPNSFSELVNMTDEKGVLRVCGPFKNLTNKINLLFTTLRNLDLQDISFSLWEEGVSLIIEKIKMGKLKIDDLPEEFKPDDSSKSFNPADALLKLLSYKTTPSGGYSSSPGVPPPAFVNIKNLFIKLKQKINEPLLNPIVDECISFIEANIKDSIDRDKLFTLER